MNIIIEEPNIKNLDRINQLATQVHELHVDWRPDLYLSVKELITKENFEKLLQNKEILVAKLQEEVIGYVTFNIKEKSNPGMRYRKQLSIDAICIDENFRRQGIGTLLLEHLKEIGQQNNCTDMYLTVNEENINAIKVYEKFGFKVKGISYSIQI